MLVNQHTKIGDLLKQHPEALEAIIAIDPKLEKLRNPLLRKLMAGRVSISMAAKVAGCEQDDFFRVLKPLGFIMEVEESVQEAGTKEAPIFLQSLKPEQVKVLDVRPVLAGGNDPLKQILEKARALKTGEVLKVINTFEPTPLIAVLKKKGFRSYTDTIGPDHIETLFFREFAEALVDPPETTERGHEDWARMVAHFAGHVQEIDVRELEMPRPMMTILESLESLPEGMALFVHHKRMPVYLLPELADRGFDYRSRQLIDNEVQLLIFRNQ